MKSTINSDEAPGIHQIAINERSGGFACIFIYFA